MNLREYRSEDCPRLMELFWDSVHGAACRDYTPAQLDAWAPREMDGERWARTFSHHRTFVVEEGNEIWGLFRSSFCQQHRPKAGRGHGPGRSGGADRQGAGLFPYFGARFFHSPAFL